MAQEDVITGLERLTRSFGNLYLSEPFNIPPPLPPLPPPPPFRPRSPRSSPPCFPTCPLCLDSITTPAFSPGPCDHSFCAPCTIRYLEVLIRDTRKIPIPCPVCLLPIHHPPCLNLLAVNNRPLHSKLSDLLTTHTISLRYCANPACSTPFEFIADKGSGNSEEKHRVHCPECEMDTCAKCNVLWHEGQNCQEYQRETNTDGLYKLMREKRWKQCPACWAVVERIDGCSHMECTCGAHFCYICGDEYATKRDGCMVFCHCSEEEEEEIDEEENVFQVILERRRRDSDEEMEDRMQTWNRPGAFLRGRY